MTEMFDLLARALPIMLGGGVVQIVVLLVKRRSDMHTADVAAQKTEAEADAVVVASAERSLSLSDQARDRAVKRAEQLLVDLSYAEAKLADLQLEVRELRIEVAALRRESAQQRALLDSYQNRSGKGNRNDGPESSNDLHSG